MKELKKLWPYIRPYRLNYTLVIVFGILMSLCDTGMAALVKPLFDDVFTNKNADLKLTLSLAIVGVYFFRGFFRFFHTSIIKMIVEYICADLRLDLQKKFSKLNLSYHSQNPPGVLLSKAFNDVGNVQYGLWKVADLIRDPIAAILLLGWIIYLDWKLTLMILVVLPIIFKFLKQVGRSARKYSHFQQLEFENLMTNFKEPLDGIRIVQSYNLEKFTENKLAKSLKKFLGLRKRIVYREEVASPVTEFIGALTFACVLYYKASLVIAGTGTTGDFMSYLTALAFIQKPVKNLQDAYVRFQNMLVATGRVFDILEETSMVPIISNPKPFPKNFTNILFKDVSFQYTEEKPLLKNINFNVKRGEVIALVGESGSGKSTLVNLLERFYDPSSGQILIDGVQTTDMDLHDLRENIALVTQDVFLFDDTVEENIRSGNPDIETVSVEESASLANATDFILKSEKQFQSRTGDRGTRFSGGEKQRISIARAIYKNAPILILDEATSALDSQSEQDVQRGLETLMKGRTVFVVAHRLSTIVNADRIFVMKEGQIVESGTHNELLSKNGIYQNFYQIQSMS